MKGPKELIVYGNASKKVVKRILLLHLSPSLSLMDVLLDHGIPVASSCKGEGTCKKCVAIFQGELVLTCQKKLGDLSPMTEVIEVQFSYL